MNVSTSAYSTENPIETKRGPLTPWELPSLLVPLHLHRVKSKKKKPIERRHFPAILSFIYRNRFCVATQVQRRFSSILRSDRTARRHLEELQTLGYLGLVPSRGLGPVFPKVFYVTGKGVRRLRESLAAQGKSWQPTRLDRRGRRSDEGFSADHVIHELLITEFLLAVWQTIEARPDLELLKIERRSLVKHPSFQVSLGGHASRLIPDALFLFRQKGEGMVCSLVEMDLGTMNVKQIQTKYHRYLAWAKSPTGQQFLIDLYRRHGAADPRPTFRLLVVCQGRTGGDDEHRLKEWVAVAKKIPSQLRDRIWLTTVSAIRQHQHDGIPLVAPVWLRGRDGQGPQIGEMPRHALFPAVPLAK